MADTREKLIELLNDHTCLEDKDDCAEECSACIADHLIANGVTVQAWIPVTERLPEPGKILTTDGDRVYLSNGARLYRSPEGKIRIPENYGTGAVVTHWMPTPELPKEV